ncbi:enhancer of polycomb homolog 1-like isoform X2 [Watersipora subatra]|uniref:enhancer of polycomb homolog 1-like isoform X2 n=1 Tax=Watersipora subatra TaxID=2589382 RepID=UPI00355C8AD1
MSKLSFRARQLDVYKAMPIYRSEEIPEVTDVAAINRAVPQMPTGMEKEEETEHHLQRALSAQQVYGTSQALVIPIPDIDDARRQYEQIYPTNYKPPKQYIHAQTYGVDQEIPDYDIDSEDEAWLENQSKKMEITPKVFEEMIDRLEKGSGQQVVELKDAKVLLKEDDDLIITVYDYWLNKRLKGTAHSLIPTVKCEKRDGSTTNNPYVAFRRRTEKMQTRKNRKNDEVSYEKMLKLRRDLQRAVTVLEMIKKREKCKKELLQLTIDILDKRYEMDDFNGSNLNYAEAQKVVRSSLYPLYHDQTIKETSEVTTRKLKRKYEKKKHKTGAIVYHTEVDVMDYGSNEDDAVSPGMSVSDQEDEAHPDGSFAFRRKKHCNYHAPLESSGSWPWDPLHDGRHVETRYRYSLTSIDCGPESHRCIGYARRRRGRGGRVILDRAYAEQHATFWDKVFEASIPQLSISSRSTEHLQSSSDTTTLKEGSMDSPTFHDFITDNKWLHFSPADDHNSANALFNGALLDMSSGDIQDAIDPLIDNTDPIIDIVPESMSDSSLPLGFMPIVTTPLNSPTTEFSQSSHNPDTSHNEVPLVSANCDTHDSTTSINSKTPSTPSSAKSTTSFDYEPHHKQLQTLKVG